MLPNTALTRATILRDARVQIALILAVGLCLRLFRLGGQSLWLDEAVAYSEAMKPTLADVFGPAFGSPEPRLHVGLLHYWLKLSASDEHARLLSVVFGSATIYVVYRLVRVVFSPVVGIVAAGLLAINPFHIWYSQEVRMYSMFFFFVVLSTLFLWRAVEQPTWLRWLAYATSITLCGLIQFIAALVALGHGSFALWHHNRRALLIKLATAYALTGIVLLPAVDNFVTGRQFIPLKQIEKPFSVANAAYAFYAHSVGFSFGPSIYEIQANTSMAAVRPYAPQVALAAIVFALPFALGWIRLVPATSSSGRAPLKLMLALIAASAGGGFLLDATTSLTANPRHVIAALLPYLAVISLGICHLGRRAGTVAFLAVATVSGVSLSNYFSDVRFAKEDARSAARYLASIVDPTTPILVLTYPEPIRHYLPSHRIHGPFAIGGGPESPDFHRKLASLIGSSQRFVLVDLRAWHTDPERQVEAACDRILSRTRERRFHGVRVIEYAPSAVRQPPHGEPTMSHAQRHSGLPTGH